MKIEKCRICEKPFCRNEEVKDDNPDICPRCKEQAYENSKRS